jgi:hypothetical protein
VESLLTRKREHKPNRIELQQGNGNIVPDLHLGEAPEHRKHAWKAQIKEIEDEYWALEAGMPKAKRGIIEDADPREEELFAQDVENETTGKEGEIQKEVEATSWTSLPAPSIEEEPIILRPRRNPKSGDSALGVSVLSVKGWIGSLEDKLVDLRLDSCADITLISEETHTGLINLPPIRQGHRMTLAQLTDKDTTIKGYMKLPILM